MNDLFNSATTRQKPLAELLRPASIDEIIGHRKILEPGSRLRRAIDSGRIGSVILYGPPGVGKTTIARAIGATLKKTFRTLHPAENSVADIRAVTKEAAIQPTLLFVDEIHRFNTDRQEHLLAQTEEGIFDFIGATTGNPYHVLAPGLVSRSTIVQLEPLNIDDLEEIVRRAISHLTSNGYAVTIDPSAARQIAGRANGDGRRVINVIEDLTRGYAEGTPVHITDASVDAAYHGSPIPYDRKGDAHYDVISAFIKSMRGSDPDATLYWLARLIHSGEDPRFIARRIMIHASEDVGLADNSALQTAVAAAQAVEKIGYPEARIILAHAALHIARAPKSNSAYRGIDLALDHVTKEAMIPVPPHLRDGHYAGATKLGHTGYRFPHSTSTGWVDQKYAPGIKFGQFYQSDARPPFNTYEGRSDQFWHDVTGFIPAARKFDQE